MPPRTDVDLEERKLATRFLRGTGIEIGAAQRPIEVNPAYCSVIYLDRLTGAQLKERFPEIGDQEITSPDIICDVATTGLAFIQDGKLDFVIASHLLEHLPNPLGFLLECHRVLRESGILLLIVPDKNYTFDRDREITPLAHLVRDLRANQTTVDKEHLIDFIVKAGKRSIPLNPWSRRKLLQREMDRSIHVHVWTCNELIELLEYLVGQEGSSWELCECYLPKGVRDESVVVLRKTGAQTADALAHFKQNAAALFVREALIQRFLHEPDAQEAPQQGQAAPPAEIDGRDQNGDACRPDNPPPKDLTDATGRSAGHVVGRVYQQTGLPSDRMDDR